MSVSRSPHNHANPAMDKMVSHSVWRSLKRKKKEYDVNKKKCDVNKSENTLARSELVYGPNNSAP